MRYQSLKYYTVVKGEYGEPDVYTLEKRFKGIIWMKAATSFIDGKQKSAMVPTLMYDVGSISVDPSKLNLIRNTDGTDYIITKENQPEGISGIIPQSFQAKVEITLVKAG